MKEALIIVDLQNDFCPGGALPAAKGNEIIPVINRLMDKFNFIVASKDWHPIDTVHFDKWPPHCVRGSHGALFHPDLKAEKIQLVALKGTGNSDDGYSTFEATNVDLAHWLKRNKVEHVYITGIATEYCVKATALDAVKNDFQVHVVSDAIAAVEQKIGDGKKALEKMRDNHIQVISSTELLMD